MTQQAMPSGEQFSPTSAENAVVVELEQWSDGTGGPSSADNC